MVSCLTVYGSYEQQKLYTQKYIIIAREAGWRYGILSTVL